MATNARIVVAASTLVVLLTAATLGNLGPVEVALFTALFVGWVVFVVLWVVMPAARAHHR